MMTKHCMKLGLALGLVVVGCLPACQGTSGEPADQAESVGSTSEAIGSSCSIAVADATATGGAATAITSPTTYNNPGCYRGYVVDIERYASRYTDTCWQGRDAQTVLAWADAMPTTQASCEGASLVVELFKRVTTETSGVMERSWEYEGRQTVRGTWTAPTPGAFLDLSGCSLSLPITGFVPNETYRLALTARASNATTRAFTLSSMEKSCVR
jgi:hypothetical protein